MTQKNMARLSILNRLLSFPAIKARDWKSSDFDGGVKIGDLVSLNCAPVTKYYLSWVREIENNNGWPKYLLESIEDGELCWWSNVGLDYYDREKVVNNPSWRWDDEQFSFRERWNRVCFKKNDAYIVLPCEPFFEGDGSVVLDVRIRFSIHEYHNPVKFDKWAKVTMKMMDEYYRDSSKKYEEWRVAKAATSTPDGATDTP